MKRYVCLDLEMSEVTSKQRRYIGGLRNEIIQIGAVMLDEKYKIIGKLATAQVCEFLWKTNCVWQA